MPVEQLGPFPGEWADVDWSPADGAFVFAYLERPGEIAVIRVRDSQVWPASGRSKALGRWGLYLRCAADGAGNVCVVLQDGRDRNPATGQFYAAIVVLFPRDGQPREIPCPAGPAFGQNAVEVVGMPSGWFVHICTSSTSHWLGRLGSDGDWASVRPIPWPETSQGFADGFTRMDDVRLSVPGMVCPSTADGLSLGQNTSGPDRLVARHGDVLFTALPGVAFEPHLASDGAGRWLGCARTPAGAALFALTPPFVADPLPPPPPVLPDVPWETDPDGVIEDIAEWLFSPNQGPDVHVETLPDGRRIRFYCKSDEGSGDGPGYYIGEHWDVSNDPNDFNVGHLEDASMGRRVLNGKEVYPWDIPDEPAGNRARVWASCKLQRVWFADGRRLWMPRRCVSGTKIRYRTDMTWTAPTWERPASKVWGNMTIDITVDVGYGRINGRDVRVRAAYIPNGNPEVNYYGPPNGKNAWVIAAGNSDPWARHEIGAPLGAFSMDRVTFAMVTGAPTFTSRYEPPARPQPYGRIVTPQPPAPPPPPKEPEMTTADAAKLAAYPAPSDIVQGALAVFRANLLERDRIEPDIMTGGALRYFFQFYGPTMAAQQVLNGIPGDANGWGGYSVTAVRTAMAAYDRDQKPQQPPVPPPTGRVLGPISVNRRDFEVPNA